MRVRALSPLGRGALAVCLGLAGLSISCERAADSPPDAAGETATLYRVRGEVRKVAEDGTMAVIDHEEIPGYMAAMSMPFYPKEPTLFLALKSGQRIEFDYHVAGTRSWVENITVLPESAAKPPSDPRTAP